MTYESVYRKHHHSTCRVKTKKSSPEYGFGPSHKQFATWTSLARNIQTGDVMPPADPSVSLLAVPFQCSLFRSTFGCSISVLIRCSVPHLAVPFQCSLFRSTVGCSISVFAVPFHSWLFHFSVRCSVPHLAVPFQCSLFRSTFGSSISVFAVPFHSWLFHFSVRCCVSQLAVPFQCSLFRFTIGCSISVFAVPFHTVGCSISVFAVPFDGKLCHFMSRWTVSGPFVWAVPFQQW